MTVDLQEDKMVEEYRNIKLAEKEGINLNLSNEAKMSQKEIDEEFDNLDLSKF